MEGGGDGRPIYVAMNSPAAKQKKLMGRLFLVLKFKVEILHVFSFNQL